MPHQLSCPCGSKNHIPFFEYTSPPKGETAFDIGNQNYQRKYTQCQDCGHFLSVTNMDLGFIYDGAYVDQTYGDKMLKTFKRIINLPLDQSDNEGRANFLISHAENHFSKEKKISLLDVGAGLGIFPWRMKKAGWEVTALDPDARMTEHIQRNVDVPAVTKDFNADDCSDLGQFDVITFNKVLEHVEDPYPLLTKAKEHLKPQGFIYIELPDIAAAKEGKGREEFFIEHHHVFSMKSLLILVENAEFNCHVLERIIEPSSKYTLRCIVTAA